jgi:hypothetical protein
MDLSKRKKRWERNTDSKNDNGRGNGGLAPRQREDSNPRQEREGNAGVWSRRR